MEKIQTPKDQLREKYDNKAKRIEIGAFLVWCTAAALLSIGVYGGLKSISILELDMLGGIILLKRNQRRERAELASLGNQ
ncbi:hypothetical protein HZB88_04460 [archaeon]|nr:hypothetical protein [archaeon]